MSNALNGNKNKMKSKDKNSFLKTNYKQRNTGTKFNSIGKLISMNYPLLQNSNEKKQKYNDKNNNKAENIFRTNKKEKSPISNKININLQQIYNSKSQNDLTQNYTEKKLYGTINHFSIKASPEKSQFNLNLIPKLNINLKEDNNQIKDSLIKNNDLLYNANYPEHKFPKLNFHSNIVNHTHNIFFSKSSEKFKKLNKKIGPQDYKSNDSFSLKNSPIENKIINPIDNKQKFILRKKSNKKETKNRLINSQELVNNVSNNLLNQNLDSNEKHDYIISKYASYTLGGTDAFGRIKQNQDSYLTKEEDNFSKNREYTFGVFDGHGLQGHLVSESIKNYLNNCNYEQYSTKKKIISMFGSLSSTIENSHNFDPFCSGSTVVLVHISKEKIICANCGDSRAILISENGNGNTIVKLSRDHKPNLMEEKKRIIAAGGRVERIYGMGPFRVWFKDADYPGLAMSRSIGDTLAHKIGVSDIPEIMEFNINSVKPKALIVASDGVWEFMTNEQVKNILIKYTNNHDALKCSKEIVEKARQIWKGTTYAIDDITCVVAFFEKV